MLTKLEKQILDLIIREYSSEEICHKLGLSEFVLRRYKKSIMKKTGTTNIIGLVKYTIFNKLLTQPND